MIRVRFGNIEVFFSFWFFAVIAAILVAGRETLALYLLLPVAIHESGHLIAMAICRVRVESVAFTAFSIDVRRSAPATAGYARDIVISLGGAAANLLAALLLYLFAFQSLRVMLLLAVNVAVALFNAIPIGSLDGGQVLRTVLERRGDLERAYKVSRICSFLLLIPLFAAAIFLLLRGEGNLSLLLACLYLAGTVIFTK